MGYTIAITGNIKWALFSFSTEFDPTDESEPSPAVILVVHREIRDCSFVVDFLRMLFPGMGRRTALEDGGPEKDPLRLTEGRASGEGDPEDTGDASLAGGPGGSGWGTVKKAILTS